MAQNTSTRTTKMAKWGVFYKSPFRSAYNTAPTFTFEGEDAEAQARKKVVACYTANPMGQADYKAKKLSK